MDLAEGTLEPSKKPRLERHLSQCTECAQALSALREIPALLRDTGPHADEETWLRQRRNIMRAIGSQPEQIRSRFPLGARWGMGLAAAAGLLLAVIGYQGLRYTGNLIEERSINLASLDTNSVLELAALAQGIGAPSDWLLGEVSPDDANPSEAASLPWGVPVGAETGLGDLNDEDLDRLGDLLGEQMG